MAFFKISLLILLTFCLPISGIHSQLSNKTPQPALHFPYQQQGLTDREAAAHLLNRFTHGIRVGDIDAVLKMGLENWFLQQLEGNAKDEKLEKMLSAYPSLKLTNAQVVQQYPKIGKVIKMAVRDGVLNEDEIKTTDRKKLREKLSAYFREKNFKPTQSLIKDFASQKILRASFSENQLQEVMTGFWFNHFNVSFSKGQAVQYIPAYERDVIRPNATGLFADLLIATAKSPAMLLYLDNFNSSVSKDSAQMQQRFNGNRKNRNRAMQNMDDEEKKKLAKIKQKKAQGLNENYAREVMELHTLGVDGGYTQQDVTEAARILTGWTFFPYDEELSGPLNKIINTVGEDKLKQRGFVREGDFFFAMNRHDQQEKSVLGQHYPSGVGYEEGVRFLRYLANQKATAVFISRKIATFFVSDNPSKELVNRLADEFISSNGDIKKLLIRLVESPEFWHKDAIRSKTKSPFEVVIGSIRALNAQVDNPYAVYKQIDKMGQKLYYYQAPTGFPDRANYWINTGGLINRMNFGIEMADNRLKGLSVNLLQLNQNHEPGDPASALKTYAPLLIPERDLTATYKRIEPLLSNPTVVSNISNLAKAQQSESSPKSASSTMDLDLLLNDVFNEDNEKQATSKEQNSLSQIVGIILGSPEFQRK